MIETLRRQWLERSPREQWLLGIMFALLAVVVFVFGIILPLDSAIGEARERLDRAAVQQGQIATRVAAIEAARRLPPPTLPGPLAAAVGGAAQDAGFTLDRADAQGVDRVSVAIPAAKSSALFQWLGALERRGIFPETLNLRPNPDGSLAVDSVLRRRQP